MPWTTAVTKNVSSVVMISSSKVAQKRCLMQLEAPAQRLDRPEPLEQQRGGRDRPHDREPDRRDAARDQAEQERDQHQRDHRQQPERALEGEPPRPAGGRLSAQPRVRDGLEADRLDDERREVADERAEPGRDPERRPRCRRGSPDVSNCERSVSSDAVSRTDRIVSGRIGTMTASISGFQCRMTTFRAASRISPMLSGRSDAVATAAKVLESARFMRSRRPWPAGSRACRTHPRRCRAR